MIGRLRGVVIERTSNRVVVDVNGVGYVVSISAVANFRLGQEVDLHIYTHVREDTLQLFGFPDSLEREIFDLLIGVPNIGPVKAMGILATPVSDLIALVVRKEAPKLAKLPGVGKKTAERMLIDLPDKFAALAPAHAVAELPSTPPGTGDQRTMNDLVSALVNLGFKNVVAEEAAERAVKRLGPAASFERLLKESLSQFAR